MSDYLRSVAERLLGRVPLVEPRVPGLFEPGGPSVAAGWEHDTMIEAPGDDGAAPLGRALPDAPAAPRPAREPMPARPEDGRVAQVRPPATAPEIARPHAAAPKIAAAIVPPDAGVPPPAEAREPWMRARPLPGQPEPPVPGTERASLPAQTRTGDDGPTEVPAATRVTPGRRERNSSTEEGVLDAPRRARATVHDDAEARSIVGELRGDERRDREGVAWRAADAPRVTARLVASPAVSHDTVDREAAGPTIRVTIGRVELRAVAPAPSAVVPRAAPYTMSLEEYVRRRRTGEA